MTPAQKAKAAYLEGLSERQAGENSPVSDAHRQQAFSNESPPAVDKPNRQASASHTSHIAHQMSRSSDPTTPIPPRPSPALPQHHPFAPQGEVYVASGMPFWKTPGGGLTADIY